ncbi:hypothetical protein ACFL2V_12275 [Pseudomonadota bacterium]
MKRKLFSIFCMLLLTAVTCCIQISAGDEDNPEIEDEIWDTQIALYDIVSAWFYEKENEPDFLFTAMKIRNLSVKKKDAVYSIRWNMNGNEYICGLDTSSFKENIFRSGDPKRATSWQWKRMPECEGEYDRDESIITWKIPKNSIGNPHQGDILEQTRAHAVPGFPISFIYFILGKDYRDFAPHDLDSYGREYIIQY